jgi:uncharacterized protein YcbK (DUF882 family)
MANLERFSQEADSVKAMHDRRHFLKALVGGLASLAVSPAWAVGSPRRLSLHHVHTGEDLDLECGVAGFGPDALSRIDHFLRCHYTNEVAAIDPATVELLSGIQERLACRRIRIISGYRSPTYNELLRRQGRGVASGSLHLKGLAIDFAVPGIGTDEVFEVARSFRRGGVGKYPDFVHIDSGRVRYW